MRYGFETQDGQQIEFIGEMTMSVGNGLDLDTRFGYDASKRPQSLTRRKRNKAKTATINIAVNRIAVVDLFSEIQKYESLAGCTGRLVWSDLDEGVWCIKDVSISIATDAIDIASAIQVSMSLSEGYVKTENTAHHAKNVVVSIL